MTKALSSVESALDSGNGNGRSLAGAGSHRGVAANADSKGGASEPINLRVLLELRRRLKSVAEKELATGTDRFRTLRGELRRSEAELRLCARVLQSHAAQLSQTISRTEAARVRATQTCARLTSVERENEDLGQQLARAQAAAGSLQLSVRADDHARHGTLDSFVLAAGALMNELALAVRDQSSTSARTHDLIEESEVLAARARMLQSCFQTVHMAMLDLCEAITDALQSGNVVTDDAPDGDAFQVAAGAQSAPKL
jgi:chromosome segregation ATPase